MNKDFLTISSCIMLHSFINISIKEIKHPVIKNEWVYPNFHSNERYMLDRVKKHGMLYFLLTVHDTLNYNVTHSNGMIIILTSSSMKEQYRVNYLTKMEIFHLEKIETTIHRYACSPFI